MKITIVTDTDKSAIFIMASAVKRHNPNLDIRIVPFHPKKANADQISEMKKSLKDCDLIDCQYWKSGSKVKEIMPDLWSAKPKILTHHNPYNLHEQDWSEYKQLVVLNSYQKCHLPQAVLIPHCVDQDFFKFNEQYSKEKIVNMTVARIEGKKGVLEVAQACAALKYHMMIVGRVSDRTYMDQVKKAGGKFLSFKNDITDEELRNCYARAAIHVCNSVDNYESGTLPILESMSCGVPVLTRPIGHVPDINTKDNLRLLTGNSDDVAGIQQALQEMMEDRAGRERMRVIAKESIKDRTHPRYARDFADLYHSVLAQTDTTPGQ